MNQTKAIPPPKAATISNATAENVVVDPYALPPESWKERGVAETQKPVDAKGELRALATAADAALAALAYAVSTFAQKGLYDEGEHVDEAASRLRVALSSARKALGPTVHVLKADPGPFRAVWSGAKPYEVRKFDRDFRVGDELKLLEHDRGTGQYSGAKIVARVTWMTKPGEYGLPNDLGVLGIEILEKQEA